jgi:hypothetical protein
LVFHVGQRRPGSADFRTCGANRESESAEGQPFSSTLQIAKSDVIRLDRASSPGREHQFVRNACLAGHHGCEQSSIAQFDKGEISYFLELVNRPCAQFRWTKMYRLGILWTLAELEVAPLKGDQFSLTPGERDDAGRIEKSSSLA